MHVLSCFQDFRLIGYLLSDDAEVGVSAPPLLYFRVKDPDAQKFVFGVAMAAIQAFNLINFFCQGFSKA